MDVILDLIVCTTEGNSFGMTCTSFHVGSISIAFGILHLFCRMSKTCGVLLGLLIGDGWSISFKLFFPNQDGFQETEQVRSFLVDVCVLDCVF